MAKVRTDPRRMKPRYNPMPNRREARHKGRIKLLPCYSCGAGGVNEAHHVLTDFPGKRWRRDHRFLVPLCAACHRGNGGVHAEGNEAKWCADKGIDNVAEAKRLEAESVAMGVLSDG